MSLTLHYHPLSSFCMKVLIALYETDAPFTPRIVNLMDAGERASLLALWPIGKFPVLRDEARGLTLPESSNIIDYLAQHYPGKTQLIPADPDEAREMRLRDRLCDLYVHIPMQKVVADRLRPEGRNDAFGVEEAKGTMRAALGIVEAEMDGKQWAMGDTFTMADCSAAPPLFYAEKVMPFRQTHPRTSAYLDRLMERPSFARVLAEAEPYFKMFPG
jgi:glutathione S-transferase